MTDVRKGQIPRAMTREEFRARFHAQFTDPAYQAAWDAVERIDAIAWDGYATNRKSPLSSKAGPGYADPGYELSDEWRATRHAIEAAERRQKDRSTPSRV